MVWSLPPITGRQPIHGLDVYINGMESVSEAATSSVIVLPVRVFTKICIVRLTANVGIGVLKTKETSP